MMLWDILSYFDIFWTTEERTTAVWKLYMCQVFTIL